MLKAMVPTKTTASSRPASPPAAKSRQASEKRGRGASRSSRLIGRTRSCFQSATTFSRSVASAAPCTTRTSLSAEKSARRVPMITAETPMPRRNMT